MQNQTNYDQSARKNATLQWNTNPCGALSTDDQNSLDYFLRVEKNRYHLQPASSS